MSDFPFGDVPGEAVRREECNGHRRSQARHQPRLTYGTMMRREVVVIVTRNGRNGGQRDSGRHCQERDDQPKCACRGHSSLPGA